MIHRLDCSSRFVRRISVLFAMILPVAGCYTGGDPDHEFEAVVRRCANPFTVDGEERSAGCPGNSVLRRC